MMKERATVPLASLPGISDSYPARVEIDVGELWNLILRAMGNRGGQAKSGPLRVFSTKAKVPYEVECERRRYDEDENGNPVPVTDTVTHTVMARTAQAAQKEAAFVDERELRRNGKSDVWIRHCKVKRIRENN